MAGGAYIKIKDGNIFIHAPGKVEKKAAVHSFSGPTEMITHLPILPKMDGLFNVSVQLVDKMNTPYANKAYFAESESGQRYEGVTDKKGFTQRIYTEKEEEVFFHLLENHDYPDAVPNEEEGDQ